MRRPWITLAAACLAACFTEVGNADDERLVQAQFRIEYGQPPPALPKRATVGTVLILRFYLEVREAEFHLLDSATNRRADYHLWKEAGALLPVDFTGKDPAATLPTQTVGGIDPLDLRLECALPPARTLDLDTLDFARFADRGYIKGLYVVGRDSTAFLFALPAGRALNLVYPKPMLESWYSDGSYRCQFIFYADKWMGSASLSTASVVKDAAGRKIILLDGAHNPSAYSALSAAFPKSFNAPSVSMGSIP